MNLKLLSKLQSNDSVYLILQRKSGTKLNYYIISRNVSYDIISSGEITGYLPERSMSFELRISSIVPLIEKGYNFEIEYEDGVLSFISENGNIRVLPSSVESMDSSCLTIIDKYLKFMSSLINIDRLKHQIEGLEEDLNKLKNNAHHLEMMRLLDSMDTVDVIPEIESDRDLQKKIEDKEKNIKILSNKLDIINEINFSEFSELALAASRKHTVVNMCGEYALVDMGISYLFKKQECPVISIQGALLNVLIRNSAGAGFFMFEGDLVYVNGSTDKVVVFINKYLPNTKVDNSLITKGIVLESFNIKIKGLLSAISLLKNDFKKCVINLNKGIFYLTNDLDEEVSIKFEVEDANSLQLIKAKRGAISEVPFNFSDIIVPVEVKSILSFFKDNLIIYVKSNKIIFRNENLFLVFGR